MERNRGGGEGILTGCPLYAGRPWKALQIQNKQKNPTGLPSWSSERYIGKLTNALCSMKSDGRTAHPTWGRFCPEEHFRGVTLKVSPQPGGLLRCGRRHKSSNPSPPTGRGDRSVPRALDPALDGGQRQKKLQTAFKLLGA